MEEQIILKELDKSMDKVDFSQLQQGDQFQVLTRYLNDTCVFDKNILFTLVQIKELLEWLCEANNIDVKAKRKEKAKMLEEQMEKNIQTSKEQLQNFKA